MAGPFFNAFLPEVPGGLGNAEAMTQMAPPVERMARTRVKKIFGVPVPERRAATFLGGLANMPRITPGAGIGNFLQGFSSGVGGALQQGNVYDESVRRDEDAAVDAAYKQAMIDKMKTPDAAEDGRTAEQKNFDAWLKMTPEQRKEFGTYRNITDNARQPSMFDRWLTMTPEQREEYKTFSNVSDKVEDPNKRGLADLNVLSDNFRQDRDVMNFTVVRDNKRRIDAGLKQGTGQGDLAAVFAFMRVLDPESVVRETEFKNAEQAVGYVQRTYNLPKRWFTGERLTPEGREGFKKMAGELYNQQKGTYDSKVSLYKKQGAAFNVPTDLFIPNYDNSDPLGVR